MGLAYATSIPDYERRHSDQVQIIKAKSIYLIVGGVLQLGLGVFGIAWRKRAFFQYRKSILQEHDPSA